MTSTQSGPMTSTQTSLALSRTASASSLAFEPDHDEPLASIAGGEFDVPAVSGASAEGVAVEHTQQVFVFANGAVVCWSTSRNDDANLLDELEPFAATIGARPR